MKYEFVKVDEDTSILKYKDKEFTFSKTVGLIEKLQNSNFAAKTNMMKTLKAKGETANDYIVIKHEGNKTIEDKSNLVELEHYFLGLERAKVYDEICQEFTNMTYTELMLDIGLDVTDVEQIKDFTLKLSVAITKTSETETPSIETI